MWARRRESKRIQQENRRRSAAWRVIAADLTQAVEQASDRQRRAATEQVLQQRLTALPVERLTDAGRAVVAQAKADTRGATAEQVTAWARQIRAETVGDDFVDDPLFEWADLVGGGTLSELADLLSEHLSGPILTAVDPDAPEVLRERDRLLGLLGRRT